MGKLSSLIGSSNRNRFNSAVILAGGSGTRFDEKLVKQFAEVAGVPVIVRAARAFENCGFIHEIVVVTRPQDTDGVRNILEGNGITKLTRVVAGGETRQASAKNGFDAVNPECDYVSIHDAARCLVEEKDIKAVFEAAYLYGAAALGYHATDTIKKTDLLGNVKETVKREDTWMVMTPQVFKADIYRAASYTAEKAGFLGTDDCSLCERAGFGVKLIEGDRNNIKITYKDDIAVAETLLKLRENR